jgi:hypothetical protein
MAYKWHVDFYANGELNTSGELTSEQIQLVIKIIDTLKELNK